jgi:hypothetical protein
MGITAQEERELTESRFWRPEVGRQHTVVFSDWRFERRAFKQYPDSQPLDEDLRPTFVASVVELDGVSQFPMKEFSSSNRNLNRLLMIAVRSSEEAKRGWVKLHLSRIDKKTYNVIDLCVVNQAMREPVAVPSRYQLAVEQIRG